MSAKRKSTKHKKGGGGTKGRHAPEETEEESPAAGAGDTHAPAHMSKPTRHPDFSGYLEEIGFIKAMTQVVVELYEEPVKPTDPIEYFLNRIATNVASPLKEELKVKQEEVANYEKKMTELMAENKALRDKLMPHEQIPEHINLDELDVDEGTEEELEEDPGAEANTATGQVDVDVNANNELSK